MRPLTELRRIFVQAINGLMSLLPDDPLSMRVRGGLVRTLGNSLGQNSRIAGGTFVYGGNLIVGDDCFVARDCYFDLSAEVRLGDNVVVGHGATFITSEHEVGPESRRASNTVTPRAIAVGDGCWIGANATILPGVIIGSGAIVAAGAVVVRSVEPNTLVGGVPARHLKSL